MSRTVFILLLVYISSFSKDVLACIDMKINDLFILSPFYCSILALFVTYPILVYNNKRLEKINSRNNIPRYKFYKEIRFLFIYAGILAVFLTISFLSFIILS